MAIKKIKDGEYKDTETGSFITLYSCQVQTKDRKKVIRNGLNASIHLKGKGNKYESIATCDAGGIRKILKKAKSIIDKHI